MKMVTLETLPGIIYFITMRVVFEKKSYREISELQALYPQMTGLSARSIRRFCARHEISSTSRLSASQIDVTVFLRYSFVYK